MSRRPTCARLAVFYLALLVVTSQIGGAHADGLKAGTGRSVLSKLLVALAVVFTTIAGAPLLLVILGFGSTGIRKGSYASKMMGLARGQVVANGLLAGLQSAGVRGIGIFGNALLLTVGLAVSLVVNASLDASYENYDG